MTGSSADFALSGRVALVTGSSQGIGLAIAQRLREAGAAVMRNARSAENAGPDSGDTGAPGDAFHAADVTTEDGARALVAATLARFGRLDIVINNAGLQTRGAWSDIDADAWDAVMAANARSVHLVVGAAVPAIRASAGGGVIVNIASVRAERPGAGRAHYSASKAAVVALTRGLAAELGPLGIRVNAISPGLVDRPGLEEAWPEGVARFRQDAPLGRIGRAVDVANACVFLASPAAAWITGVNLVVDGGVSLVR